ncbi:MAG: (Fe-S)-binding protein [Deltaproteobacteria bacterium]
MEGSLHVHENLYTAMHKCTRCGQCAYGNEDAGFDILCPMQIKGKFFTYSAGGLMQLARALYEGKVGLSESVRDILYLCTTCGVCEVNCGVIEGQVDLFTLIKKELVKSGVPLMDGHKMLVKNTVERKAPYGGRLPGRTEWLKKVRDFAHPQIFYYVGCVSSYRETEIADAFTSILDKLDIPFAVSEEEWCCGAPLFFAGHEEKAENLAKHNVKAIEDSGASAVVLTCPTCAMIFKKYYPQWLKRPLAFEVLHVTEFLDRLGEQGKLKLNAGRQPKTATYHDPCHLGRGLNVYDAPRRILQSIKGIQLSELSRIRENSFCCGGGGLVPTGFPSLSDELAEQRASEMKATGADLLVSSCPACKENLKIAAKKMKKGAEVLDITELVDRVLTDMRV